MRRGLLALSLLVPGAFACSAPPAPPAPAVPPPPSSAPPPVVPPSSASATASAPPARPPARLPDAPDARPPSDLGRAECQRGEVRGCDALAEYWGGRERVPAGREAEAKADAEILRVACQEKSVASACMGMALMLKYGSATGKRDGDAAKPFWGKVKELGDLNGFRDAPSEAGRAVLARTQKQCDEGRARACTQVGWAAYNGVQRDKSLPEAYEAYREACRLGSALGCRWAGHYAHTYQELKAKDAAVALLDRSCQGQFPAGCAELGVVRTAGAPELLARACDEGSRDGCWLAGKALLEQGKAAQKEAGRRLQQACEAEQDEACDALGPMLERGQGVPRDEAAAVLAYQRGCLANLEPSCVALSRLAGADRASTCVLRDKPLARIGERGAKALRQACKENKEAAWCRGVVACP